MINTTVKLLDCTLRDGGYYNNWDFDSELVHDYLVAMAAIKIDFIEIGFRNLKNENFKGGCAFSTDSFINSLAIPLELRDKIGVMINGSDLILKQVTTLTENELQSNYQNRVLEKLFSHKSQSPVTLVRIACHVHEFEQCLPASAWLKEQGYLVGFNLMQVADRTDVELTRLAQLASEYPIDVLYFADSMGSLISEQVTAIVSAFKQGWKGELGIHTHENMGQAVTNSLQAIKDGVTWVDSTITGMGRGPGNAQTEYLSIALDDYRTQSSNSTKLLELIRKYFIPMQKQYGWGTNPYYYLAGKYGIHPSYIQEMLADFRYSEVDILAVIDHLQIEGGKKFSLNTLNSARHFYSGEPRGTWNPSDIMGGRDVLILGAGIGVGRHCVAIEAYIKQCNPFVVALNTQKGIDETLINIRIACHPVRLLADCQEHLKLSQPLVTPFSMLPNDIKEELSQKEVFDFGIAVQPEVFEFYPTHCTIPNSLVLAYALAVVTSGQANRILLAGFDGYTADDSRNKEVTMLLKNYQKAQNKLEIISLTPTRYELPTQSIYAFER